MKNGKQLLSGILRTAQLGQTSIRSVLDTGMAPGLRQALESQLREYDTIELEAFSIASQRGWELPEVGLSRRVMTDLTARMNLYRSNTDSQIAAMLIRSNTGGLIRGLKELHRFPGSDERVSILSQKLLDCETANIRKMQSFL